MLSCLTPSSRNIPTVHTLSLPEPGGDLVVFLQWGKSVHHSHIVQSHSDFVLQTYFWNSMVIRTNSYRFKRNMFQHQSTSSGEEKKTTNIDPAVSQAIILHVPDTVVNRFTHRLLLQELPWHIKWSTNKSKAQHRRRRRS